MSLLQYLKSDLVNRQAVAEATPLPVVLRDSSGTEGPLGTSGDPVFTSAATAGRTSAISHARPADTSAYTANDVIGVTDTSTAAAFEFTSVAGASGGDVLITSVALEVDLSAVTSGMTSFDLYLYSITPPSALKDNAAFDLASGDRASFLGKLSLGSPVDLGSTLYVEQNGVNKQVKAASSSLFGLLVTVGAYTPASGTVYKVTIHTVAL